MECPNWVCVCVHLKVFRSRSCTSQEVRGLTLAFTSKYKGMWSKVHTPTYICSTPNTQLMRWAMNEFKWMYCHLSSSPDFNLTNFPASPISLSFILSPHSPSLALRFVLFMLCVSRFDLWPLVSCEGWGESPLVCGGEMCVVFVKSVLVLV